MSEDETAKVVRRARTDQNRRIIFDPQTRPGVSALLSTAALCLGARPEQLAEEIGDAGSGRLKQVTTEAINDFLKGHRARRRELAKDHELAHRALARGNQRANEIAERTMDEVRSAMGTIY